MSAPAERDPEIDAVGVPAERDPEIDVVIVTARGSWRLLDDCLRSLAANPPAHGPLAIHVVDNASGDGLGDAVRAGHPRVDLVELPDNLGFAHGCNHASRHATAPLVLLLNPDTIVPAGAIDRLVDALAEHPRAAVVGPRLVGLDGHPDHNAKRSFPTAGAALRHFTRRSGERPGYGRTDIPELGAGRVDAVSGSCMLVRRSAIEAVGLLDEGYWMYGEDLDWCARLSRAGWEVRYEGAATVVHVKHGITGRRRTLRTNWAFHRSMGRFYRRFQSGERRWLDTLVYVGVVCRFLGSAAWSATARAITATVNR